MRMFCPINRGIQFFACPVHNIAYVVQEGQEPGTLEPIKRVKGTVEYTSEELA